MNELRSPSSAPLLSLILPVRNGWDDTFRVLMALLSAPSTVRRELVVVDDGSVDETPLGLPHLEALVLHRNDEPLGLVRAANQGAALASGRYLLFLGNGAAPAGAWLEPLVAALEADPQLGAVGPQRVDAAGVPAPADAARAWAAATGRALPPEGVVALGRDGLLVRTEAFRAVGGFDAAFQDHLGELDLCFRLQDHGFRVALEPASTLPVRAPAGVGVGEAAEDVAQLAARWELRFGPPREGPAPRAAEDEAPLDPSLRDVARSFPAASPDPSAPPLAVCAVHPDLDGTWELELRIQDGTRKRGGKLRRSYAEPLGDVEIPFLPGGQRRTVSPAEIVAHFAAGYDFEAESERYARSLAAGAPARVAFTVVRSDVMGGGTINLFRLANWLVDMGAEVGIYSDSALPAWVRVNARFHIIGDPAQRYAAIREPLVVVYSILELQRVLRAIDHRGKRIYHFCQGAEEFHYWTEPPPPLETPNGCFDLLNAVPVGRLVVSPHLRRYFAEQYGQRAVTIVNGIDTGIFHPPARPRTFSKDEIVILCNGNPNHPLKCVGTAKDALTLLARRHPRWRLKLVNVCGLPLGIPPLLLQDGFVTEMRFGLTPPEVREALHGADAFVNTSWYEGFGLPSLEAMACGTPVVQADNHGLEGIVEDGRDCLRVPPAAPEALAAALEKLFLDPALRARLAAGGLETAARYDLARQREETAAAFSRMTGVRLDAGQARPSGVTAAGERPRFSVLVPTYNQDRYLPATLDSLLSQTSPDWEALVVNDGSTDATPEVMARYAARDRRFRTFHKQNGGVASALNRGIAEGRGEWFCWLSSDDLFLPEKLSVHLQAIQADPGLRFMHTDYQLLHERTGQITPSGLPKEGFIPPLPQQVLKFLRINYFNGISVAVHRTVFDRVGVFDEEFRYGQDYDLWLRASAAYRSRFLETATCVTRLHPSQGTALFTEAGIYDSARASAAFLTRHPYEDLFPVLDLSQLGQALQALSATLGVAFLGDSFVTRCGFLSILLDRVKEWISAQSDGIRFAILNELQVAFDHQSRPEVKAGLKVLTSMPPGPFRFKAPNPFALLEKQLLRLERRGDAQEHAAVKRYIEMIGDARTRGQLARAS
jgi:GT2 family glycosyltransferase/glycosyltransferase involved in cell wall biosynthesis